VFSFNTLTTDDRIVMNATGEAAVFQTHPAGWPEEDPVLEVTAVLR